MKLYDLILQLLTKYPQLRDSDKKLAWTIWFKQNLCNEGYITKEDFVDRAEHFETIRRTRQKVSEDHPEIKPSETIQAYRDEIESKKGNFVYQAKIKTSDEKNEPYQTYAGLEQHLEAIRKVLKIKN